MALSMAMWEIEVLTNTYGDKDMVILVVLVQSVGKLVVDDIQADCVELNNVANVEECSHTFDHVIWYMACYSR